MKKRLGRIFAILLLYLVISISFTLSISITPVQAQQLGCCEKTKDGNYCEEVSREDCDVASGAYDENLDCEEASFCAEEKGGCCFFEDRGECIGEVLQRECSDRDGRHFDSGCESVPECTQGCSIIWSQCTLTTKTENERLRETYDNIEVQFIEGLDASECRAQCSQQEFGCCISDGAYRFVMRAECEGTFESDKICSSLENSPCEPRKGSGCYDGSLYWEDSCGNKEEVKENCSYSEGRYCKDDEENNVAECINVNCETSYTDKWNVHDPKLGGPRENAESWCIYESPTGNYLDKPGSRHYRHACLNGEEVVEPCRNFREEVCIQGSDGGSQTFSQRDVSGIPNYDLSPIAENDEAYVVRNGLSGADCIENSIYDGVSSSSTTVPLGFAFWESQGIAGMNAFGLINLLGGGRFGALQGLIGPQQVVSGLASQRNDLLRTESSRNADAICSAADESVTVKWIVPKGPLSTCSPECIENCWAEKELFPNVGKWITKKADECKALGDCGIDFGVESDLPSGLGSFTVFWKGDAPGPRPTAVNPVKVVWWGAARGVFGGMKHLSNEFSGFLDLIKRAGDLLMKRGGGGGGSGFDFGAVGIGAGIGATGFVLGPVFGIGGIIIGAILGIFLGGCEEVTKTVSVSCSAWQPLAGGANCGLCKQPDKFETLKTIDGDSLNVCSEYRCRALGSTCEYIETLDGPDCIDSAPNDINPPEITPNLDVLEEQGFRIKDNGRSGFVIENLLPAFEPIVLAIKTNEPAQCSYTTDFNEASNDINEYPDTFTSGLTRDHRKIISYPLSDAREVVETTYYVKCQDRNGYANPAPYAIKFSTQPEPDITPPIIVNVVGAEFLKAGENSTRITALVDDAHNVECRFAKQDISYGDMPEGNQMLCENYRADDLVFRCHAELNDLIVGENKFFIKCIDPEGSNSQSDAAFEYNVKGTEALEVIVLADSPSGIIFTNDITLAVQTSKGAENGNAVCEYSKNGASFIEFRHTGETQHSQSQTRLQKGHYIYDIRCKDIAMNEVTIKIEFDVAEDTDAPALLNVYKEGGILYIILNEESNCETSDIDFEFGSGIQMTDPGETVHTIEINKDRFIIKCRDSFENLLDPYEIIP